MARYHFRDWAQIGNYINPVSLKEGMSHTALDYTKLTFIQIYFVCSHNTIVPGAVMPIWYICQPGLMESIRIYSCITVSEMKLCDYIAVPPC